MIFFRLNLKCPREKLHTQGDDYIEHSMWPLKNKL